MATVTDEIIDLHDRIMGKLFNAAQNKHQQQFQASSMAINAKARLCGRIGQVLVDAKQSAATHSPPLRPSCPGMPSSISPSSVGQSIFSM